MQQIQISIPKPCHQDWNQMTPEERGRFCSMCKKTVLDFSDKSDDEILDFIKSHRDENLCGRFRNDQLARPIRRIELPMPVYRSQLSFINTFLLALLFCFGTTLFSCTTPNTDAAANNALETAGLIEAIPEVTVDDTSKAAAIENISPGSDRLMVFGDFSVSPEFVPNPPPPPDSKDEIFTTKGDIEFIPDASELPVDTVELADVNIIARNPEYLMVGGLVAVEITEEHIEHSCSFPLDSASEEKIIQNEGHTFIQNNERSFFASVYPNPSDGLLNIEFLPDKEQYVKVDLFDALGNLVRNFIPRQLLQPERQTLKVDVSDQPPGIYFLRISTGDKVKTERVVIAAK